MNLIYIIIKEIFDILISIIGCILLVPIYLILKIIFIMSKDYSNIIYKQDRIGKSGKIFTIYKFRTMNNTAEDDLKNILKDSKKKKEWDKNQKLKEDPRITKIGKVLRKTGIDEMPQFINILKGEMSLIGPRPLIIGELKKHHGNKKIYESIKPGIIGWWVCNKDSAKTYKERLELEYYYIKKRTLWLDIKCIIKTIRYILIENKENNSK